MRPYDEYTKKRQKQNKLKTENGRKKQIDKRTIMAGMRAFHANGQLRATN